MPAATEITLELPELHDGQLAIRDSTARYRVAAIGRRWGKSHGGLDEATETMLAGGRVGWFAPTYKLLAGEGGVWPYVKRMLRPVIAHASEQEHTLRLVTGGAIEFWSLENEGAEKARGREYDLIVIDEAAMVPDLLDQWDNAIRPMLTTRQGRGLFLSTPRGYNDFYTLYKRGLENTYVEWQSFHAPSATSPHFPPAEWAALLDAVQRGELSAATFAQEYEAVFTAPEGLVYGLDRDGIAFYEPARNLVAARIPWAACKWRIAAIDPGGKDPTGMVAIGVSVDDRHHVYYADRRAGMVAVVDPALRGGSMHEWLADLDAVAPLDAVIVGETGGGSFVETLVRLGWPAYPMNRDRGIGIQHVRGLFKSGRLTIGPAFRQAFDAEVYSYRFAEQRPGQVGGDAWATTVDSSEHHADLLDALRYGCVGVLDGYPGARLPGGMRRAGEAGTGMRRAGLVSSPGMGMRRASRV